MEHVPKALQRHGESESRSIIFDLCRALRRRATGNTQDTMHGGVTYPFQK